jgi:hypothetical protein
LSQLLTTYVPEAKCRTAVSQKRSCWHRRRAAPRSGRTTSMRREWNLLEEGARLDATRAKGPLSSPWDRSPKGLGRQVVEMERPRWLAWVETKEIE